MNIKKVWLLLLTMSTIIKPITSTGGLITKTSLTAANKDKFKKSKGPSTGLMAAGAVVGIAAAASKAASTHYIINLTGRTIILNFYAKNPFTGKSTWYDAKTFGPLIWAGKGTTNLLDTLNYQLLPTPIDMHTNTCFNVTVDAFKFDSSKLKDPKIHGTYMPTPATSPTPNDFKVTLDGDQLVITQLDTCMGIKISGAEKKQWPSAEDIRVSRLTPAEKITTLQQKNMDMQNDIKKLKKAIKKTSNITKKNNRRKMITNKKERIKKNEKTIAKLQAEIAASPAQNASAQTTTPAPATPVAIAPTASPAQGASTQTTTPAPATPFGKTPATPPAVANNSTDIKNSPKTSDVQSDNEQETDFKTAPNFDDYIGAQEDGDSQDDSDDDDDDSAA